MPPEQLRHTVRVVAEGNALLDPAVTRRVIQHFAVETEATKPQARAFATLTDREQEVAWLVAKGLSNQEIGEALALSYWTVKTHIKRILGKLDVHDRSQIVITVYEAGALDRSRP